VAGIRYPKYMNPQKKPKASKPWTAEEIKDFEIMKARIGIHVHKKEYAIAHELIHRVARERIERESGIVEFKQLGLSDDVLRWLKKHDIVYVVDMYTADHPAVFGCKLAKPHLIWELQETSDAYGLKFNLLEYMPESAKPITQQPWLSAESHYVGDELDSMVDHIGYTYHRKPPSSNSKQT